MRLLAYQIFSSVVSITICYVQNYYYDAAPEESVCLRYHREKTHASKNVNIHPGDNTLILVPGLRTFAYTETFANRN